MNGRLEPGDIERMLAGVPSPEPPAGLADRIKAEIPDALPRPRVPRTPERRRAWPHVPSPRPSVTISLAAHAALLVLAGLVGWWLHGNALPEPPFGLAHTARPAGGVLDGTGADGMIDAAREPLSAFDLDPQLAVYAAIADRLRMGFLPRPQDVRGTDLVNAFDFGDPAPKSGDFALYADGSPAPGSDDPARRLVRFALRARTVPETGSRASSRLVAVDAEANVEFNPRVVERYRLVGSEPPAAAAPAPGVPPRHAPKVIAAGEAVSAVYDVRLQPRPEGDRVATFVVRYRSADDNGSRRATRELKLRDLSSSWADAPPRLRLAALAAEFADALREPDDARRLALAEIEREADALHRAFPERTDIAQFADMTRLALAARPGVPVIDVETGSPALVSKVDPVYPEAARAAHVEGTVMLEVAVDASGTVRDVRVVESVPQLDQAAIDAVRQWRYRPSPAGGNVTIGVAFRLGHP